MRFMYILLTLIYLGMLGMGGFQAAVSFLVWEYLPPPNPAGILGDGEVIKPDIEGVITIPVTCIKRV